EGLVRSGAEVGAVRADRESGIRRRLRDLHRPLGVSSGHVHIAAPLDHLELGLRGVHDDLLGGELPERHRAQSWSHDHPFILPARVSPYPSIWRKPPWFRAD